MEIFIKRSILFTLCLLQVSIGLAFSQAYFTPHNDLTGLCIALIDIEQKSIHGAMYMFTDKKVAQALINARKRGVKISMVLDQISMVGCGKGKLLQEHGISVAVHRTAEFNPYTTALMHHKFFLFGCNKNNRPLLWTGSWNCTVRASAHNDENVIILDDEAIIQKYLEYYQDLEQRLKADQ